MFQKTKTVDGTMTTYTVAFWMLCIYNLPNGDIKFRFFRSEIDANKEREYLIARAIASMSHRAVKELAARQEILMKHFRSGRNALAYQAHSEMLAFAQDELEVRRKTNQKHPII